MKPDLKLLDSPDWKDYALLDSGDGKRLERFGPYQFIRPEHQAVWRPALDPEAWGKAHATFQSTNEETGGRWEFQRKVEPTWPMQYRGLKFLGRLSNSRHLGLFPEQATHWDWIADQVRLVKGEMNVLNLFGYTGMASLAAAQAGAKVTHVDASKKSIIWARENQDLSGLSEKPVRWIVDDALKFVQREARRMQGYQGIILDPPKFGRGPKGEVWEVFDMLPELLGACRKALAEKPRFVIITAYAIRASALSLYYALEEMMAGLKGEIVTGELVIRERSADRLLSTAIFVRWSAGPEAKGAGQ